MTALTLLTRPQDEWRISLCGAVALARPDGISQVVSGAQAQLVLAYLLLEARPVQRDELAELLWDGPLPDHWAGAVRGLVAKVRAALVQAGLPDDCLVATGGVLRLTLPPEVVVDVQEAAQCIEQAGISLAAGTAETTVQQARRAHTTLRSLFLPRCDGSWVRLTRDRLQELGRLAAQHEIEAHLILGDTATAMLRAPTRRSLAIPWMKRPITC